MTERAKRRKTMSEIEKCNIPMGSDTEKGLFEDEALEVIWELREKEETELEDVIKELGERGGVIEMEKDGLIKIRDGKVFLTEEGEKRARDITRRHRLAERLFTDVLDLTEYEADACKFEHAISPEVEEAICTFLGHPPTCPHGRPIPKGRCCATFTQKIRPLVQRLTDITVGSSAKVVFITGQIMGRLSSIGLIPGAIIKLQQKSPSYVVGIEETTIAIDEEMARGIYVRGF
jgi:DtxR family Mn-dependent transcriptional regulator